MPPDRTDRVVAALSDPGRRALLDALRERDGQTVGELGESVPHLGRHAVLKHVGVLEDAGLVTTHKHGRARLCYLNAAPLVDLASRWLDDYGVHLGGALLAIRDHAQRPFTSEPEPAMPQSDSPRPPLHRHSVIIDAPPERVWKALVEESPQWYFGTDLKVASADGTPAAGAEYHYDYPDGSVAAEGTILTVVPNERMEMTFSPVWDDAVRDEAPCRLVWRIDIVEGTTMLTVEHHDLDPDSQTAAQMDGGSVYLVSNLKTWVETGRQMSA